MTQTNDLPQGQLKRINAYPGLMIDHTVWQDAHQYHADQMRLHNAALHGEGIAEGLWVSLAATENTLHVEAGIALDAAGRFVVVSESGEYRVANRPGVVYLILTYREVDGGPTSSGVPGVGPSNYVVEAYQIKERDTLPREPHLELARVNVDPSLGPIRPAADPQNPRVNELDLRFRKQIGVSTGGALRTVLAPPTTSAAPLPNMLGLGLVQHSGEGWDHHREGLRYLMREVEAAYGFPVRLFGGVELADVARVDVAYLSGWGTVAYAPAEIDALQQLLRQGGTVIAEGCPGGPSGEVGAREFALSFIELSSALTFNLEEIQRGHPALTARYPFATPPVGARGKALLVEGGGLLYSDSDYGCAWNGGAQDAPLPRGAIRDALELGVNLSLYRRTLA